MRLAAVALPLIGALGGLLGVTAAAAQPVLESLTLERAIEIALEQSPLIRAARHDVQAAEAGVDRARAGFLPRLDFSESFNRSDNPVFVFGSKLNQGRFTQGDFEIDRLNTPDAVNNFRTALSITQPLFTGGRASLGLDRARAGREAASQGSERQRQEVIFAVARAYYRVLLAQADVQVLRSALSAAAGIAEVARSRFEAGFVVESDLLSAQVRQAALHEQTITASSRVVLAKAALNDVLGRELETSFEVSDALAPRPAPTLSDPSLESLALERRPDYRRLQAELRAADGTLALARREFLPTLSAVGSYELNRRDLIGGTQDSWFLGLSLQWNLFNGLADQARVKEATALLERGHALLARTASAVRLEVKEAVLAARAAEERIEVARRAADQAAESLRIVQERYAAGLTTLVSVLSTEAALTDARASVSRAVYDVNVAHARLDLATGTIAGERFR